MSFTCFFDHLFLYRLLWKQSSLLSLSVKPSAHGWSALERRPSVNRRSSWPRRSCPPVLRKPKRRRSLIECRWQAQRRIILAGNFRTASWFCNCFLCPSLDEEVRNLIYLVCVSIGSKVFYSKLKTFQYLLLYSCLSLLGIKLPLVISQNKK